MSADLAIDLPRALPGADPDADSGSDAQHLTPEEMPRWRTLLELHWRARLERITELSLAYHDAEEAGARGGKGAATGTKAARPTRLLLHEAVAQRRELAEIEAALGRVTSGTFGHC